MLRLSASEAEESLFPWRHAEAVTSKSKRPKHLKIMKSFYVYIMTNKVHTVLYTGITNDIIRRNYEHKNKLVKGFTEKYNVTKLVYHKQFGTALEAIAEEKRIKGWIRQKKINLINNINPEWKDLSANF